MPYDIRGPQQPHDEPEHDEPRVDAASETAPPAAGAAEAGAPDVEATAEAPAAETPEGEAPNAETPDADVPAADVPDAEASNAETPAAEVPAVAPAAEVPAVAPAAEVPDAVAPAAEPLSSELELDDDLELQDVEPERSPSAIPEDSVVAPADEQPEQLSASEASAIEPPGEPVPVEAAAPEQQADDVPAADQPAEGAEPQPALDETTAYVPNWEEDEDTSYAATTTFAPAAPADDPYVDQPYAPDDSRTRLFDELAEPVPAPAAAAVVKPGPKHPHRPPLLVWVVTLVFVSLATMCTFLYPSFTGYDEAAHVDLTYSYYNGNAFYDPGDRLISVGVEHAADQIQPPVGQPLKSTPPNPRGLRDSFDALGGDAALADSPANQMVRNPPLYYAIGAGVMHLVPGSHDLPYDRWVAILRYLSILMIAPLPILAWATTKTLVGHGPAAVAASTLPLALPNLTRIGASVNNDNLLILLTGILALMLAKVIAGDLRARTGFGIGVVLALACLTKSYGLALTVVVAIAYLIAWFRHRTEPWVPLGWAAGVTLAGAGWWWIRNLVLFHTLQPGGIGDPYNPGTAAVIGPDQSSPGHTIGDFLNDYMATIVPRIWGGIGLPEYPEFARNLTWVWAGIVVVGALLALGFGFRGRGGRGSVVVFIVPTVFFLALPMEQSARRYLFNGWLTSTQGWYLYPTITAIAVLVGVGYSRALGRKLAPWLPLVIVLGALATQAMAWRQLLKTWWVPPNISGKSEQTKQALRAVLHWSPWPDPVTTAPFVAVVAGTVLAIIAAVAYGWNHRDGKDEPEITDGRNKPPAAPSEPEPEQFVEEDEEPAFVWRVATAR
jgi:hypothetical protein